MPRRGDRLERTEADVFAEQDVDRAASARQRSRVALEQRPHRFGVVVVVVCEGDAAQPTARVDRGRQSR